MADDAYAATVNPLAKTVVQRAPAPLRRPVLVLLRTAFGATRNRLPGLAAEIAFWVLLSLPSLAVSVIAILGLVAATGSDWEAQLVQRAVEVSRVALTTQAIDNVVEPLLRRLIEDTGFGVISSAFVAAVWTASRAVKAALTAIALVATRAEPRSGWKDRLLGFAITIGALIVGAVLAPLLVAGPGFAEQLQGVVTIDLRWLVDLWQALYWPGVLVAATMAIAALYHLGVPQRTRWRDELPGAITATGVWLAGSAGLRLYGAYITGTESAYGPLAGPIVVLIWFWLTGFAVLLGAQLNAEIAAETRRR